MASQRAANRLERGPQITDRIDSTAIKSRDVQLTRDGRSARSLWSPQLQVRQLQERKDEEKAERLRSEPLRSVELQSRELRVIVSQPRNPARQLPIEG